MLIKPWKNYKFDNVAIQFAGHLFYNNNLYSKNAAAELIAKLIGIYKDSPQTILKELQGQFAFIYEDNNLVIGFVDKIRSFPLFYNQNNIFINPKEYIIATDNNLLDQQGLIEFQMAGYTLGNKTLFKSIKQVKPGEFVIIDKKQKLTINHVYYEFYTPVIKHSTRESLLEEINSVINRSIQKTIEIANGRKIIIPLSAGFDSRLILGKLLEQNYSNILCYTYGPKNIWEAKIAKEVALKANVKWEFVELTQKEKKTYNTNERKEYYSNYSGLCSVPHLADFYALKKLINEGKIDASDSIIVNGQSGDFITGGHISKNIRNDSVENLLNNYIGKHFGLWSNLLNEENIKIIKTEILNHYPELLDHHDRTILAKQYERIECQERQFKYVVNGQRAYDYYEFDWHLPLWSDEMLNFWSTLSIDDKIGQNSYIEYCKKYNPKGLFDIPTKGNTNSLPIPLYLILSFIKLIAKFSPINKDLIKRKYFNYFDKYAPYYPMDNYFIYLKDSIFHRHCVSYWSKYFLTENEIKT